MRRVKYWYQNFCPTQNTPPAPTAAAESLEMGGFKIGSFNIIPTSIVMTTW